LYEEYTFNDPSFSVYRYNLVVNLRLLKKFEEAEKEAEILIVGSKNANHFYWYGVILSDQNKHKKALE